MLPWPMHDMTDQSTRDSTDTAHDGTIKRVSTTPSQAETAVKVAPQEQGGGDDLQHECLHRSSSDQVLAWRAYSRAKGAAVTPWATIEANTHRLPTTHTRSFPERLAASTV